MIKGYRTLVSIAAFMVLPFSTILTGFHLSKFKPVICEQGNKLMILIGPDACSELVDRADALGAMLILAFLAYLRFQTTTPVGQSSSPDQPERK